MRTIVAVLLTCFIALTSFAQSKVDVQLTKLSSTTCEVTLLPSEPEIGVLSNVVFALKWRSDQAIAVGEPTPINLINIQKSGQVRTWGSWRYQFYSGCGLVSGPIESFTISIPFSGKGEVMLADDEFVKQANGQYFVSIGGQDVTGNIVATKKLSEQQLVTLYFDRMLGRFYVKKEGVFYDLIGQRVAVFNEAELVIVRKRD